MVRRMDELNRFFFFANLDVIAFAQRDIDLAIARELGVVVVAVVDHEGYPTATIDHDGSIAQRVWADWH